MVPVGLISSNWGGTYIQNWSPEEAVLPCNCSWGSGGLFNSMVYPFTVGPLALSGFAW